MYQNWTQSKLYLEALINDQHEMPIKNIFKKVLHQKTILSIFFFLSLKKFITGYGK